MGGMSFSDALVKIKEGALLARSSWNGVGMYVFLVPGSSFQVNRAPLIGVFEEGTPVTYRPHIDMHTAQGEIVPWVASQSDLIEEDWYVV